jgi:hypothetical protein
MQLTIFIKHNQLTNCNGINSLALRPEIMLMLNLRIQLVAKAQLIQMVRVRLTDMQFMGHHRMHLEKSTGMAILTHYKFLSEPSLEMDLARQSSQYENNS